MHASPEMPLSAFGNTSNSADVLYVYRRDTPSSDLPIAQLCSYLGHSAACTAHLTGYGSYFVLAVNLSGTSMCGGSFWHPNTCVLYVCSYRRTRGCLCYFDSEHAYCDEVEVLRNVSLLTFVFSFLSDIAGEPHVNINMNV